MRKIDESVNQLWFIYSQAGEPWAGLRIATFVKSIGSPVFDIVLIHNELPERMGPRIWDDIAEREQWRKVKVIELPTMSEVAEAMR
jgi:hypothetical protein